MLIRSTAFIIRHGDNMRMKIMKQNALDFSESAQYTEDRYSKNETPLTVRCKHFARLWPTVDLCSSKMMIAEVLHQHVLYCDFHFQITAGAF